MAGSKLTRTAYDAATTTVLADNTNEDISEGDIRGRYDDTSASAAFLADTNTYTGQQRFNKGADVISTAVLPLITDGNYFDVTGVVTITSFADLGGAGAVITLQFDGILTLTHHATDLILPAGGNITTAAGDHATFVNYASGDYRCINYQRADGTAIALSAGAGDVTKVGTPVNNQIGVWTGDGTLEGDADFTWNGTALALLNLYAKTVAIKNDAGTNKAVLDWVDADDALDVYSPGDIRLRTDDLTEWRNIAGTVLAALDHSTGTWDFQGNALSNFTGVVSDTATVYDYLYIDAAAMVPSTTSGAEAGTRELATNDVMIDYLAFDTGTDEYAQFKWKAPEQITSNPVVRFKFDMATETGAATTLIFGMQFIIMSDDESLDQAWSTATVAGAVTMTTTNDIYMSDGACTATLTGLAAGDTVFFRVFRDVSADTHAVDGQLLGVHLQYPKNNTATSVWS